MQAPRKRVLTEKAAWGAANIKRPRMAPAPTPTVTAAAKNSDSAVVTEPAAKPTTVDRRARVEDVPEDDEVIDVDADSEAEADGDKSASEESESEEAELSTCNSHSRI